MRLYPTEGSLNDRKEYGYLSQAAVNVTKIILRRDTKEVPTYLGKIGNKFTIYPTEGSLNDKK